MVWPSRPCEVITLPEGTKHFRVADAVLLRSGVEEKQMAVSVDVDRDENHTKGVEAVVDVTFHSSWFVFEVCGAKQLLIGELYFRR